MRDVHEKYGYILDPHGACGYAGLRDRLKEGETGIFLETAHPAKFKETVESAVNNRYLSDVTSCLQGDKPEFNVDIPERLNVFMKGKKQSIECSESFEAFKDYLRK
jgi:threonine synthase